MDHARQPWKSVFMSTYLLVWARHVQDIDRKNEQTAAILKRQADQIIELEALYKEEQVLRKRYFNMMEGVSPFLVPFVSLCFIYQNLLHLTVCPLLLSRLWVSAFLCSCGSWPLMYHKLLFSSLFLNEESFGTADDMLDVEKK